MDRAAEVYHVYGLVSVLTSLLGVEGHRDDHVRRRGGGGAGNNVDEDKKGCYSCCPEQLRRNRPFASGGVGKREELPGGGSCLQLVDPHTSPFRTEHRCPLLFVERTTAVAVPPVALDAMHGADTTAHYIDDYPDFEKRTAVVSRQTRTNVMKTTRNSLCSTSADANRKGV